MKVLIAGATGFIGRALCKEFSNYHEVVALTRNIKKANQIPGSHIKCIQWDGYNLGNWTEAIEGANTVINLCGQGVAEKRWTTKRKKQIQDSRFRSTETIVQAIQNVEQKPETLIQASATAWYGSIGNIKADEDSSEGKGFLAETCQMWESKIEPIKNVMRTVTIRIGVVMGKSGGILSKLVVPYRKFIGGYIGTGKQYVPWISMADTVRAIRFLIENKNCRGPYNFTAPQPIMLKELCIELGKILKRPSWTKMPAWVTKLIYGEMADELLLASYNIIPKRLIESGFEFKHNKINEALTEILSD